MTSTAGIVGSASKGIGFLSGDAEYVRKRSLKNQQDRAMRGGIMDGIIDGGESVVSGFASGVSGLVTKPYEEVSEWIHPKFQNLNPYSLHCTMLRDVITIPLLLHHRITISFIAAGKDISSFVAYSNFRLFHSFQRVLKNCGVQKF